MITARIRDLTPLDELETSGRAKRPKGTRSSLTDEARALIEKLGAKLNVLDSLVLPLGPGPARSRSGLIEFFEGRLFMGRFVGNVVDEELGIDLTIEPRMARSALAIMLGLVFNVKITQAASRLASADAPLLLVLVALIWRLAVIRGFQHGPPCRRRDRLNVGRAVRGSFDSMGTIALRVRGKTALLASRDRTREIDPLPLFVLDAAREKLRRTLGTAAPAILEEAEATLSEWFPLLPPRKRPTNDELLDAPIRYTPISEALRPAVELSRRILSDRGVGQVAAPGRRTWGALIDMAELWELFVVRRLRSDRPDLDIEHAAREEMTNLFVDETGRPAEFIAPDIIGRAGRHGPVRLVADAKYKRRTMLRDDVYQILAYQSRLGAPEAWLVYPSDIVEGPAQEADRVYRRANDPHRALRTLMMPVVEERRAGIRAALAPLPTCKEPTF